MTLKVTTEKVNGHVVYAVNGCEVDVKDIPPRSPQPSGSAKKKARQEEEEEESQYPDPNRVIFLSVANGYLSGETTGI